ncbi:hypothetical protein NECAME_12642 [Necator americanus]|uniref:Uncharacterized protein n=1 Tax=Necator americanus TaxID=51031 RepID=W2T011_NECAM|nr:hypothetical protein NECAME_12642 [Necator americanus]ETN74894.1 hypothetical protein NECAME_12642 [Necator americanus]
MSERGIWKSRFRAIRGFDSDGSISAILSERTFYWALVRTQPKSADVTYTDLKGVPYKVLKLTSFSLQR